MGNEEQHFGNHMGDSHKLSLGGTADLRSDLRYHEIEHPQRHIYTVLLSRTNPFQCSCHYLQSIPWVHALICLGKAIRCDPLSSWSLDTHCRFTFVTTSQVSTPLRPFVTTSLGHHFQKSTHHPAWMYCFVMWDTTILSKSPHHPAWMYCFVSQFYLSPHTTLGGCIVLFCDVSYHNSI